MRPRVQQITLGTGSTSVYFPVDTQLSSPQYQVQFVQTGGTGSITTLSASYTAWPVLARGVTSATWVQVTAAATPFSVIVNDALSCFRYAATVSGTVVLEFITLAAGSEWR